MEITLNHDKTKVLIEMDSDRFILLRRIHGKFNMGTFRTWGFTQDEKDITRNEWYDKLATTARKLGYDRMF